MEKILDALRAAADLQYRDFQSRLVPTIPAETMIGVRTPRLREIAKSAARDEKTAGVFLRELPHAYFEENLIHFFVVAEMKDFDACVAEVERFLPYVDCWPVCDQASPKSFRKNHARLLPHIKQWISSAHVYTSRYGMRILMNEFLDEDFSEGFPEIVAERMDEKGADEDYYLKMMASWYFATALAKQWDAAVPFIEKHRLEPWTHNKAIQKALESFRVTEAHKEYLRSLKTNRQSGD